MADSENVWIQLQTLKFKWHIHYSKIQNIRIGKHPDWPPIITGNGTYIKEYETTVENLFSSLIIHEWYGHGIKKYGSYKKRPDHHKVYELVKNESFNPYWKKTTDRYKKKMDEKLNHYNNDEK